MSILVGCAYYLGIYECLQNCVYIYTHMSIRSIRPCIYICSNMCVYIYIAISISLSTSMSRSATTVQDMGIDIDTD